MNTYWVASYLVDGLLIDTSGSQPAGELMFNLEKDPLEWFVNTHYHEDHNGANRPHPREVRDQHLCSS